MHGSKKFYVEIFLVSFAALLLEISYTRVLSFKLFYYYSYLIIGFALLGLGSGGVCVAILPRLRRIPLPRLLAAAALLGAWAVGVGYFVIALTPLSTTGYWLHGGMELVKLLGICFALFAPFLMIGVMIAALFSRILDSLHRLYFADLLGAGIACAVVVPLIRRVGPPASVFVAGVVLALVAARLAYKQHRRIEYASGLTAAVLALGVVFPGLLPEPVTADVKTIRPETPRLFSKWSPVFRIDVTPVAGDTTDAVRIIHHDGLWGSTLHRFNGDLASLSRFETDDRSYPFRVPEVPPREVLVIGAAGGHEVLASLYFGAEHVTAVELNPVTVSLLREHFNQYTGDLARHPRVTWVNDEGRSFMARQRGRYDLIYFVAPDSYSAINAASAGAFVLSESYLYTAEMIAESLRHLSDHGIICMQFGEISYERKPNRTARYVATALHAFESLGIRDARRHILVATTPSFLPVSSTILLKRNPFSEKEVENFLKTIGGLKGAIARHAGETTHDQGPVGKILTLSTADLQAWYETYPYNVRPVSDDAPFLWHFAPFRTVLTQFAAPLSGFDPEDSVGERLLLVMIAISALFAATFVLLPFVIIRDRWSQLPQKTKSFGYFAAIGLGFMFFEISLIQKLTLFLGYPTYSLTVTLMSVLVFTGVGSLLTQRYAQRRDAALVVLFAVILGMTFFYQFGLRAVMDRLLGAPLEVRIVTAVIFLAPLGFALGAFMPLGLTTVAGLSVHGETYVAWGWAVNGFFSVIGSVLTTVLSMTFGFNAVLFMAVVIYAVAVLLLRAIPHGTPVSSNPS